MAGDAVCDERRLQACILAGKKDFVSLNWTFRRLKKFSDRKYVKAFTTMFTSFTCQYASLQSAFVAHRLPACMFIHKVPL